MKASRFHAFAGFLLAASLVFLGLHPSASQAADPQPARAVSIAGLTQVDHQPVIVDILVAVHPGENPRVAAQAALHRAYPDARPFDSADYSINGLVWDQFFNNNSGDDQVDVNYNPQNLPSELQGTGDRPALSAALTTWTNVDSSTFVYALNSSDTDRCPSLVRECPGRQYFDGNNDIGWLDIKNRSVLGVTWYGTSTDEFDMVLDNATFNWYVGADVTSIPDGSYDTQTVWLHELGHGLGLGHSDDLSAVMYAYYQGPHRSLSQDDVDGIISLYPAATITPPPEPTPSPSCWPPGKCKHR
jgi:hypothetical protein